MVEDQEIRVLLPACKIPIGSEVTKRTGQAIFHIRDKIKVYGVDGKDMSIEATEGTLFLSNGGSSSAIRSDTLLCWVTTKGNLHRHLTEEFEGTPQ